MTFDTFCHSSGVAFLNSQLLMTPREEFSLRWGVTSTGTSRKLLTFWSDFESSGFSVSTTIDRPSFWTDGVRCWQTFLISSAILKGENSLKDLCSCVGVMITYLGNLIGVSQIASNLLPLMSVWNNDFISLFGLSCFGFLFSAFLFFGPWWWEEGWGWELEAFLVEKSSMRKIKNSPTWPNRPPPSTTGADFARMSRAVQQYQVGIPKHFMEWGGRHS